MNALNVLVLVVSGFVLTIQGKKKEDCYFSRMKQGMFVDYYQNKEGIEVYDICNNELCITMEIYPNGQPKRVIFEKEISPECDEINTIIPTGTVLFDDNGFYNYSQSYPLEYYESGKFKKRLVDQENSKYYKYISFGPEGDTLNVQYVNKEDYRPKEWE
ncbi:hypothetical protein GCM10009118_07380 [Wandonia haliotis]|uniref:Uncharacterized protein n=1 Tax=Wandonia haliotis TaxID=574963 RepID=A0ABN1MM76_9FLAO